MISSMRQRWRALPGLRSSFQLYLVTHPRIRGGGRTSTSDLHDNIRPSMCYYRSDLRPDCSIFKFECLPYTSGAKTVLSSVQRDLQCPPATSIYL
ncbi:hypothetical protein MPTK1_2g00530 [Marchantia polymorpha subsp. ruderalis]|uniref:Uncharacterized protein n=1 Tax=Marchantia polymorpha TaxID=3197 RepID=A0A2R6X9K3_MARPO|nr:hypothetical protein MARPO_0028s0098 [Marchantia polymorpha]BBN00610.1 hypothetical protein Mp_2g00530 [Marchantia polymorpha subsp. ruderalis]|eukprot:PTQ42787.1 hypothetical protein MARPO_0028s0098 [Marchantia polymorpha]